MRVIMVDKGIVKLPQSTHLLRGSYANVFFVVCFFNHKQSIKKYLIKTTLHSNCILKVPLRMALAVMCYNGSQHRCSLFSAKSVVIWLLMKDMRWVCRDWVWLRSWWRNTFNTQDLVKCSRLFYIFLHLDMQRVPFLPQAPEGLVIVWTTRLH